MPQNKNALIRYQIIDRCLRDISSEWTLDAIIQEVSDYLISELGKKKGISKRQIEYDLSFMQSSEGYKAPIEKEKAGDKWFWYYTDRKFSITNSPLDKNDGEKLKEALLILKQFENFPQFRELEEIILKLESKAITNKKQLRPFIQFEKNELAEGNRLVRGLYDILLKNMAIDIHYQPFGKQEMVITIHPYLLKEYSNRWFLIGKNHQSGYIDTYGLDRIIRYEISNEPFIDDVNFYPEEHFKDVIGVSIPRNKDPEKIVLSFSGIQGNYIKTKPLHKSQIILKDTKKELQIEITVIPNYELRKLIWSFGDAVSIISPEILFPN